MSETRPTSYTRIDQFAQAIGRQPRVLSYYSPWLEQLRGLRFPTSSKRSDGAITLVQFDAPNLSLASLAAGQYDAYLRYRNLLP